MIPVPARKPIATLGGVALLAYGILAAAASVAAGGALARTGMAPGFGTAPFAATLNLSEPIAAGQTLTITNTNGPTIVHGGNGQTVDVVANRHFAIGGQGPDVQLTPSANGWTLGSTTTGRGSSMFGDASYVEYQVEVPAGVAVSTQATSGQVQIDGMTGPVDATTTSGSVNLSNLSGQVHTQTSSGAVTLTNVVGSLNATTSSGSITGTQLQHVQQVHTNSGSVSLESIFADATQIDSSSGSVHLKLLPGTAVQLDAQSARGSVEPQGGLQLANGVTRRDMLSGAIGSPAPGATLNVQTQSGNVVVSQ
jgi:hypothetical protein